MNQMYEAVTEQTAKAPRSPRASRARLPLTPGRAVALAIGVPACLALIANTGFTLVADAGQGKFPVRYDVPAAAGRVSVAVDGGDVQVRQVSGDRASLSGTGYYALIRPALTQGYSGGTASFGYSCRIPYGNCGLNADVNVPAGMAVSLSTDGGNATADGTTGQVSLSTGGGDVTVGQATGDLILRTSGGDVTAEGISSATVTADTGGGDIEIVFTQAPRDVRVSTDGGNVTIVVPAGTAHYDVTESTDGGNYNPSVLIDSTSPNRITASTGGGDLTIRQSAT